ncbi:MAG: TonB-dependent receptor, partial [Bacteroidota bacterium]
MKAFALVILCTIFWDQAVAQEYKASFDGEPAINAINQVAKTYDTKVSFSPSLLRNYVITKDAVADSPEALIEELLEGLPFSVKKGKRLILVLPIDEPEALIGKVVDAETNAPLAFALIETMNETSIADENGSFRLAPRADTLELQISYLGYEKQKVAIAPGLGSLTVSLQQNPTVLQEVVLNGYQQEGLFVTPSSFTLNPRQFNALPVLGETDVFKTLQLLPGVSATDESAPGIRVRGGNHSQNLVIMDGFTIYNQDHFFGILSSFNPNFTNRVNIHKGGFGAEYGGRLSSVVEVESRSRTSDQFKGAAGINFLTANAFIEAPLGEKLTLLSGFRRSFSDILQSNLYQDFLSSSRQDFIFLVEDLQGAELPLEPSVNFHNINAKLVYQPSKQTTVDFSFYQNADDYVGSLTHPDVGPTEFRFIDETDWSNLGVGLVLNHFFNSNWKLNASLGGSKYQISEALDRSNTLLEEVDFEGNIIPANTLIDANFFNSESEVTDLSVRLNNTFYLSNDNELQVGMELNDLSTEFESNSTFSDFLSGDLDTRSESIFRDGKVLILYASDAFNAGRFAANIGIRSSYYNQNKQWYLEPRFQSSYQLSNHSQLKLAYSRHNQFL